jgi:hypothetical protein
MCYKYKHVFASVLFVEVALFSDPRAVALHDALGLIEAGTPSGVSELRGELPVELLDAVAGWDAVLLPIGWFETLSPEQARYALVAVDRLRRRADAAIVVLSQALRAGRDTVASLSRATHMSNSTARQYSRVARQREQVPEIVEQLADGALSLEHASALASTDAETARSLVEHATNERVDDFVARVRKADVEKAGAKRRERQLAERGVRFSTTAEGSVKATIVLPDAEGVEFRSTLEQLADTAYRQKYPERARKLGGHEAPPLDKRLADALVAWMRGQLTGPGRPAVVVTVNAETLECTRLPNDTIPPEEAAELLQRAQVYGLIRDHTTNETIRFGRNRRLATPLQKLLLAVRYGYCFVDGCYEPAMRSDADHIKPFSHGGLTNDEHLQPGCHQHHQDKTEQEHGEHRAHAPPTRNRTRTH